jgi:mRNA interferase YafQ
LTSDPVLSPVFSTRFKRDVKQAERRDKDMAKLKTVIALQVDQRPLPADCRDHPLKGNWNGGLPQPGGMLTFSTNRA